MARSNGMHTAVMHTTMLPLLLMLLKLCGIDTNQSVAPAELKEQNEAPLLKTCETKSKGSCLKKVKHPHHTCFLFPKWSQCLIILPVHPSTSIVTMKCIKLAIFLEISITLWLYLYMIKFIHTSVIVFCRLICLYHQS